MNITTEISSNRKRDRERCRERYWWLKEHGICVKCGNRDAIRGCILCPDCVERERDRHRKVYETKKQTDPGFLESLKAKNKEYRRKRIENGLCRWCSKKATHGIYCYEHSIKRKKADARKNQKRAQEKYELGESQQFRKEHGLCLRCGTSIEESRKILNKYTCAACSERSSETAKRIWAERNSAGSP